jgi:HEAT repeat protein
MGREFCRLVFVLLLLTILCVSSQASDDQIINTFIQDLKNNNSHIRGDAANSLGILRDARAVEPLIPLLKDNDVVVRMEAADALGRIRDHRAVDPLIQALKDYPVLQAGLTDTNTRRRVIKALVDIADPKSIDALSQVIWTDDDLDSQKLAIEGIAEIKDPRAIDPLIKVVSASQIASIMHNRLYIYAGLKFTHESPIEVAVIGLKNIGKAAVDPLIKAVNDNNFGSRPAAAVALGEIGDTRAAEPLIRILKNTSEDWSLRIAAIYALGEIGDKQAIGPLIQAFHDRDQGFEDIASKALVMIQQSH